MQINILYQKTVIVAVVTGLLGFVAGQYFASSEPVNTQVSVQEHSDAYVCPMHPEITSGHQGNCPICGMDLVINRIAASKMVNDTGLPVVNISASVRNNLGIRTAVVTRGNLKRVVSTIGKITRIDPTARRIITPPFAGKLVYVVDKHDGDTVEQSELLFSVTSEKLLEAEKNYQSAYKSGNRAIATEMIPQLSKLGLRPAQIARLQKGEPAKMPVHVYSSEAGYIMARRGEAGIDVSRGFTVFNLGGDYQVIDVTAEIFERQWGWVEEGQQADMTVRGLPGTVFRGRVIRVEPPVGYTTRSLEVHLKFKTDNPGLSQSMFAHVNILGQEKHNLLMVPQAAVIRSGDGERVVVVRNDGKFQPVRVVAGEESDGRVEIISGLEEGQKVVVSGQFLIDSESNLLAGFRRMTDPVYDNESQGLVVETTTSGFSVTDSADDKQVQQ